MVKKRRQMAIETLLLLLMPMAQKLPLVILPRLPTTATATLHRPVLTDAHRFHWIFFVLAIRTLSPLQKPFSVILMRNSYPTTWSCMFGRMNQDRKSTRLNSSHVRISYAVFCLKKKKKTKKYTKKNKKKHI